MCILCVASRWSRRIVTMLPWLIIPLIILWALSQLLPPGFRFEVTSPRLACVGVLLVSLGWYELAMPRLSMWRAKRSALLRERRRIEAQEAAKWRKEATRRCRNCLSAYRDQTPGGGRFMCTFCGHVSKRPVLDVPGAQAPVGITAGLSPGGSLGNIQQSNGAGPVAGGFFGSRSSRGWVGRGWPEKGGWVSGGRGWTGNKTWAGTPTAVGWGTGNGSWGATNWPGKSWTGAAYWGGGGAGTGGAGANGAGLGFGAGNWTGGGYGGGIFSGESCIAGEPHQGGLFFALYKLFSFIFLCLRWVWKKLWRGERPGEDGNANGGRRGGQKKGDESGVSQGSRVDKARRKAEEKRQARLEREQLEAEERRQREEVARLVEERRRQRDEMLEAEKESEREAAAERERELRRERDAERRRQEKVKEKDKELAKDKSRDTDSEDSKKKKEKDHPDKKSDGEKRFETEKKTASMPNGELKKASKSAKGVTSDLGCKGTDIPVKSGSAACLKSGSTRYVGPAKGAGNAPLKCGVAHQNNTSFWGKGFTGGLTPGNKAAKAAPLSGSNLQDGSGGSGVSNGKLTDSSYSAWNRMPWTKVWGKSSQSTTEGKIVAQTGNLNLSARTDVLNQNGGKPSVNGSNGSGVFDFPQATGEAKQQAPVTSQSWQRLFSNKVISPPPSNPVSHQEPKQPAEHAKPTVDTLSTPSDSHTTLIFGHGLQGSVISQHPSVVAPVGQPVHSSAPSSVPVSSSSVTSGVAGSVFSTAVGSLPVKSSVSLPTAVPSRTAKPSQHLPIHPPVSGPLHIPAPIQVPVPVTSQSQTHVPQDQLPQILEPWGQPPLTSYDPSEVQPAGDKWRMWDTPQHSLPEPLHWNRLGSSFMDSQKDSLRTLTQSLAPENQLPASLFSPQQHVGVGCSSGELLTPLSVCNSHSLWSDNSAFESALRIWGTDSDSHQRVPPEFVDCITQEVMLDPVITADGHSYERAAIERWLQTHDTSPITGEVLPPPPGAYGSGVDKTLRPNHILRGQIIEYRENMARLARGPVQESFRDSSWSAVGGLGLGNSAWSTNPNAERPHIGGFYSTPGAHSVWSFNGPQNSVLPPPL
ncbi:hypothetical protein R1flu_005559 [Riccia fluitans]|uniref:U-box domain-containing protein n=1 Tax=Riccia fluitans TaxID=41844 RepID=A0ABD1YTR7_9MARC